MTRIVVIGAGVMGASVAYRLARPAPRSPFWRPAASAAARPSVSFAWTNAHRKTTKHRITISTSRGMKAHAALRDEFGATPWWHGGGSLEWEPEPDRAAQQAKRRAAAILGLRRRMDHRKQLQELEPDIDLATVGDAPDGLFPRRGLARSGALRACHAVRGARRHGAR